MALFDTAKKAVHDTASKLFGELAKWTPLAGGPEVSFQVNFNRPDKEESLGDLHPTDWEFTDRDTWIEYRKGQFDGLKTSVDTKALESITIEDQNGDVVGIYRVMKVMRVWDGDIFKARLVLIP